MLNRMCQQPLMSAQTIPSSLNVEERWTRNEQEDVKKAIEHLYEFKEKLSKLHPVAQQVIEDLVQRPRY